MECRGGSGDWGMQSVESRVRSVRCEVQSLLLVKCGVRSAQCGV